MFFYPIKVRLFFIDTMTNTIRNVKNYFVKQSFIWEVRVGQARPQCSAYDQASLMFINLFLLEMCPPNLARIFLLIYAIRVYY